MGYSNLILILPIILISSSTISGFNITRLLANHPNFSTFNDLLSRTGVAQGINSRQTITVLVVENSAMSSVTSKSTSSIRYILANHVILDYFDELKLGGLTSKPEGVLVTTLLQTTGIASRQQGFLNVTVTGGGNDVVFGSGVSGAQHNAKMQTVVASQPGNISVIQISEPIIAPGLEGSGASPPSADSPTPSQDSDAAPPPKNNSDDADYDEAEGPDTDDMSDDEDDDEAESPSGEDDVADSDKLKLKKSGGGKVLVGGGAMAAVLLGFQGLGLGLLL